MPNLVVSMHSQLLLVMIGYLERQVVSYDEAWDTSGSTTGTWLWIFLDSFRRYHDKSTEACRLGSPVVDLVL